MMSGEYRWNRQSGSSALECGHFKATSKNVIPTKAGIQKLLTLLDSRLRGSDKSEIYRGYLKLWVIIISCKWNSFMEFDSANWAISGFRSKASSPDSLFHFTAETAFR
jgi:hypothetical protein